MALRPTLNILSLCSGVGGLELGIALALHYRGMAARGVCYVEREAAAAASLVASMDAGWLHPAPVWSDLATFDGHPWRGNVHILASGDPCQDNSVAGKGAGAGGERFLAPAVVRIAEECRPDLIFRENVPGNADGQLHALVQALEGLGYRVAAGIFSSAETGNTMRRERMFILAERKNFGFQWSGNAWRRGDGSADGDLGMDGSQCPERRTVDSTCRIDRRHNVSRWQEGPNGSGKPGAELAGTNGERQWGEGDEGHSPSHAMQPSSPLARPSCAGSQGGQPGSSDARLQRAAAQRGGSRLPPTIIPGPANTGGWIDVLDRFPEYQPALSEEEAKSHLRRGVDAMAHRIERLRATGNGVDPVVGANAFLRLSALLATRIRSAGGNVLGNRKT